MSTRRRGSVALVPLLLLALVACQPARRDPASIERIIVIGDSVAHGLPGHFPGFIEHLDDVYPNADVVALGGPGQSPVHGFDPNTGWSDWAGQVNHWLYHGFDADLVIIQACCNRFTNEAHWRAAYDALIAKARAHDPGGDRRIVLMTTLGLPPNRGWYWRYYGTDVTIQRANWVVRQIPGVALADIDFAWSVDWGPVWLVPGLGVVRSWDELHFNDVGARAAADFLSRY